LEQALVALAAAGGAAVVQAAGTDAWAGLRHALARWFGRGDEQVQRAELERLDRTAAELAAAREDGEAGAEEARARLDAVWRFLIQDLLERLPEDERDSAADAMRDLLRRHAPPGEVAAGTGGIAVRGDLRIQADRGSVAAGIVNGDVTLPAPPAPDPTQG
jgi:predicted nucleic acid-binding protein